MENIIFLDIDGVLNNSYSKITIQSVDIIKYLIEKYKAKIVIISSRQNNGTEDKRKKIRYLFKQFGICNIDFIDPNFEGHIQDIKLPSRLLGIVDYLKKNQINNYVILDDDYHNDYKLVCLNHYKTKQFKGLTYKDLPNIVFKHPNLNNFKYINYKYRQLGEYELITNNLIKVLKKIYIKKIK